MTQRSAGTARIKQQVALALTATCGNCRRWAFSHFQQEDHNFAFCAWPNIIEPRARDPGPIQIPVGVEPIKGKLMPRDGGYRCCGFLRKFQPDDTPKENWQIGGRE